MEIKNLFKNSRTNWKYIVIVVILAVIVGGGILTWQYFGGVSKKAQKLTEEQIKAVDFNINNPNFQQGEQPDYGFYLIEKGIYYKTPIVWGELNNDDEEDAIVVLNQGSGGSAVGILIGVVINDNGKAKFIDYKGLGDRTQINNIEIKNGIIIIDIFIKGPDDPGCCPSVVKKVKYKLSENKIEEIILTDKTADLSFEALATEDWKTYKNEKYGFEVKYSPKFSFFSENKEKNAVLWGEHPESEGGLRISILQNKEGKTVEEWIEYRNKVVEMQRYTNLEDIIVDGSKGIIVSDAHTIGNWNIVAILPYKDYIFQVGFMTSIQELRLMLSTFKFLK